MDHALYFYIATENTALPRTKLEGDQLRELGRDGCHRLFCSAQAPSRAEQGTDFAESFIRRVVHDGNEQITRQECRKLLVGDAFCCEAAQQRRGHQHDPDSRLRQSLVDFAEQRRTEGDVLLAEPDRNTARLEQIVKLLGGPAPVLPRAAEKDVPTVRQGRLILDAGSDRRECPHLCVRVHHGRTCSRPAGPCAATGPADAAPAAPAASRRGVGRGRVRPVAAIAATTCGAVRCSARCTMASYWCCASCHVVILLFVIASSSTLLS